MNISMKISRHLAATAALVSAAAGCLAGTPAPGAGDAPRYKITAAALTTGPPGATAGGAPPLSRCPGSAGRRSSACTPPYAINGAGQVVGCLVNKSGWLLTEARGINGKGQIVGAGWVERDPEHPFGSRMAFLLTPLK